jgi:hypothetical protein
MNRQTCTISAVALVLGGILATTGCTQSSDADAPAAPSPTASAMSPLVGEWEMTSLEIGAEGDLQPLPYGGQVIFTASGTMAVQAANPDTDAPDGPYTVGGYEAFYGEVTRIDGDSFTVEVESALARDLVGQSLARDYDVSGDTLVLTPTDPSEGFRATYARQD